MCFYTEFIDCGNLGKSQDVELIHRSFTNSKLYLSLEKPYFSLDKIELLPLPVFAIIAIQENDDNRSRRYSENQFVVD